MHFLPLYDSVCGHERGGKKTQAAVVGGGCFWCTEAMYQSVPGIKSVISGYAGGTVPNPTYEQVCTGKTGHAEVIKVEFDPEQISYEKVIDLFWKAHDPTTLNRQGADSGTQYRSIILYSNDEEKAAAEKSKAAAAKDFKDPIVTGIVPLKEFYQPGIPSGFLRQQSNHPYNRAVTAPKVRKIQEGAMKRLLAILSLAAAACRCVPTSRAGKRRDRSSKESFSSPTLIKFQSKSCRHRQRGSRAWATRSTIILRLHPQSGVKGEFVVEQSFETSMTRHAGRPSPRSGRVEALHVTLDTAEKTERDGFSDPYDFGRIDSRNFPRSPSKRRFAPSWPRKAESKLGEYVSKVKGSQRLSLRHWPQQKSASGSS